MKKVVKFLICLLIILVHVQFLFACNGGFTDEGVVYGRSADGTYAEVVEYSGKAKKIQIKESYKDLPVTKVCDEAFSGSDITEIIIPETVIDIGVKTFYSCASLKDVKMGNDVTQIGKSVFCYCTSLKKITIGNKIEKIDDYAFYGCESLSMIELPDEITHIGAYAFFGCKSLSMLKVGDRLSYVGSDAFFGCTKLKYNCVENINYIGSFSNPNYILVEPISKKLSYAEVHKNTKIILGHAFSSCDNIERIVIPESVAYIGSYAFEECDKLTIYCETKSQPSAWSLNWNKFTQRQLDPFDSNPFGPGTSEQGSKNFIPVVWGYV